MVEFEFGTREDQTIDREGGAVTLSTRSYGFEAGRGPVQFLARYAAPAQVSLAGPNGGLVKIRDHVIVARLATLAIVVMATLWRLLDGRN